MNDRYMTVYAEDAAALFPKLPHSANKGSCGRVLCVCGSYSERGLAMCGAAYFAASSAYRVGAGIVEIFTPRKNYEALAAGLAEAVYSLYEYEENEDDVCKRLEKSIYRADCVVIGCGLGKSRMARALVATVLKKAAVPMVIDADALNIMSENAELWSLIGTEQRKRTVITPHVGEMSRLCGATIRDLLDYPVDHAASFARKYGVVCLLKDHRTVITDGDRVYLNNSGNPGMASAGMGDLLAGVMGGLLSRKTVADWADAERIGENEILYRTAVGAYLHGYAGDLACMKVGEYSLVTGDLLLEIPSAIMSFCGYDAKNARPICENLSFYPKTKKI